MRVLLCDGHRLLLEALRAALCSAGHEVVGMTTEPAQVADTARRCEPDICLVDVAFADCDGFATVAEIRSTTGSRILVLSARADKETVDAAVAAGADGFLGKFQSLEDILRGLDRVAGGEAFVPDDICIAREPAALAKRVEESTVLRFLTEREREALRRIADGESTKEIARSMDVAYSTARTHVQNVLTKLGVRSRLQAAALAARIGLAEGSERASRKAVVTHVRPGSDRAGRVGGGPPVGSRPERRPA
ncbi:LuxR C-terminal-related transcriptional regulator [Pseudonocardia lutea]|uniref:LuxR C-terminal-related transcriptional regulator n=1 Tax=Pseudonocardia lutea TaxID=2172015 RepID=A0ABW1IHL8_9PSEU